MGLRATPNTTAHTSHAIATGWVVQGGRL
jgi:hypothetical protein